MRLSLLSENMWDTNEPLPDEDEFSEHNVCPGCDTEPWSCEVCDGAWCYCDGDYPDLSGCHKCGAWYCPKCGDETRCAPCNNGNPLGPFQVSESVWDTNEPLPDEDQFNNIDQCMYCGREEGTHTQHVECDDCGAKVCQYCPTTEWNIDADYNGSSWVSMNTCPP